MDQSILSKYGMSDNDTLKEKKSFLKEHKWYIFNDLTEEQIDDEVLECCLDLIHKQRLEEL